MTSGAGVNRRPRGLTLSGGSGKNVSVRGGWPLCDVHGTCHRKAHRQTALPFGTGLGMAAAKPIGGSGPGLCPMRGFHPVPNSMIGA